MDEVIKQLTESQLRRIAEARDSSEIQQICNEQPVQVPKPSEQTERAGDNGNHNDGTGFCN